MNLNLLKYNKTIVDYHSSLAELTITQQTSFEHVQKWIETESDQLVGNERERNLWLKEETLLRYLKAKKWNETKVIEMIRATMDWRRAYGTEKLIGKEVEMGAVTGKMYIHGFDKEGRPTIYMRSSRENLKDPVQQVKFLVYMLEKAVSCMPEHVQSLNVIVDYRGFKLSSAPPFKVAREVLDILSNHYPERLGLAFQVDAPRLFWSFWKLLSPFIDPVTYAKIQFVKTDPKTGQCDELLKYYEKDMLEKAFGGTSDFEYDHAVYWPRLTESDPQ